MRLSAGREISGGLGAQWPSRIGRAVSAFIIVLAAACSTPSSPPRPTVFTLSSPAVETGGSLPAKYTCDGGASTPPLNWSGAPNGTTGYAVLMDHIAAPDDIHWYWVLYNIAPDVDRIEENQTPPGSVGTNSVNNRLEYAPPCSQGPGKKTYVFHVYALSGAPNLTATTRVSRAQLLQAVEGRVLAEARLEVTYERPSPPGAPRPAASPNGRR